MQWLKFILGLSDRFVATANNQGRIEPPKAAQRHATSRSLCIDGMVLSVAKTESFLWR